jgi:hypothetical protein
MSLSFYIREILELLNLSKSLPDNEKNSVMDIISSTLDRLEIQVSSAESSITSSIITELDDDNDIFPTPEFFLLSRDVKETKFLDIIVDGFNQSGGTLKWDVLYNFVRVKYGGLIHYLTGKKIALSTFTGKIRTFVEERSSDSRQHYFKSGTLQPRGWMPNLFSNPELCAKNNLCKWKPYCHVGGRGIWSLGAGSGRPNRMVLLIAESLYKKKGLRNQPKKID